MKTTSYYETHSIYTIMETTKFHQLCGAFNMAQDRFDTYKKDCHVLSIEIVKELKAYYEIPESQFSLYKISKEGGFELVPDALIHALTLGEDHYWSFGIGLTVCRAPETLPEELILVHIMFRQNAEGENFIKYAFGDKEFKITKGDPKSYVPFFDYVFQYIMSSYEEHMQQFIGEQTTRKMGYIQ